MIALPVEMGEPAFMPAEYVLPEYSRSKVEAAGKALAGTLTDVDAAVGIFRIAYNWRDAHVCPMRRVRYELAGIGKRAKSEAITAARIKRMKSIRKKLRETPLTLYQIQDLGGCRIIVSTIEQFHKIIGYYNLGRHSIIRQWPYVDDPKQSGYRSHHIVVKFNGSGEADIYNRQRIEISDKNAPSACMGNGCGGRWSRA
jgi:ppGpp synthetase/RelA/SpoT-type nucleotidyltranferase